MSQTSGLSTRKGSGKAYAELQQAIAAAGGNPAAPIRPGQKVSRPAADSPRVRGALKLVARIDGDRARLDKLTAYLAAARAALEARLAKKVARADVLTGRIIRLSGVLSAKKRAFKPRHQRAFDEALRARAQRTETTTEAGPK